MKKLIAIVTVTAFALGTNLFAGPGCCPSKAQAADAKKAQGACSVKDKAECKSKDAAACAEAKGQCPAGTSKSSVAKKDLKSPKDKSVN